jgi:acyl-CoA hydrolase
VSVESLQFPHVPGERSVVHVADAYASFVAIGKDLRPVKAVPRLGHEDKSSIRRNKRAGFLKQCSGIQLQCERETSQMTSIAECRELRDQLKSEIRDLYTTIRFGGDHNSGFFVPPTCSENTEKFCPAVSMKDSTLEAHRFFLQGFQNMHSTIFGGEILKWMEKHAVYCGRRFACNTEVFTLAMHSVQFHEPIFYTDAVSLRTRVVNVRNTTLEVDVEVFVDRADGRHLTSNCASFVLVSLSNFGKPRPINIELDMNNASLEEWIAHLNAMKRYKRHAAVRAEAVSQKSEVKKASSSEKGCGF